MCHNIGQNVREQVVAGLHTLKPTPFANKRRRAPIPNVNLKIAGAGAS
jgi:hypothetical protein